MSARAVDYGPHLIASTSGALRRALIVVPSPAIENARPLPGEPNAVHSRAVAELRVFAKTLGSIGCDVIEIESRSRDPFAASAADLAIVFASGAAIMRPSSPVHRAEAAWIEETFEHNDVPIAAHLSAPGLLDGSDVVLAGQNAFIGVSPRSNALGRDGFARIAQAHGFTPVEVRVDPRAPSLRSVCGVLSEDALVIAPERVDRGAFAGFDLVEAGRGDELGAGVLNTGFRHVIADVRFPRVIDALRAAGVHVEAIDLYDFGRIGLTPSVLAIDLRRG
jgi:N-dimethylarginine dimethylaminohydrolase